MPKSLRNPRTGEHYAGEISPALTKALNAAKGGEVVATSKQILNQETGESVTKWYPVDVDSLDPGPMPGEYRHVVIDGGTE